MPDHRGRTPSIKRDSLLLVPSAGIAALVSWQLYGRIPTRLNIVTDEIGYPIHRDFNVDAYFQTYRLIVIVFPLLTILLFTLLSRLAPKPQADPPLPNERKLRSVPDPQRTDSFVLGVCEILAVGTALGLEFAFWLQPRYGLWGVTIIVVALYAFLLGALSEVVRRILSSRIPLVRVALAANAAILPIAVLGLLLVSRVAGVSVGAQENYHHYDWLAAPAVIAVAVVLLLALLPTIRKRLTNSPGSGLSTVPLIIGGGLVLFMLTAKVPGPIGFMDVFHEGEWLVAATYVDQGKMYWRDIISIHGFTDDVFRWLIGLRLFENTRWGAFAGERAIFYPLFWSAFFAYFVYLLRSNWPLLVGIGVGIVGSMFHIHLRFILLPIVLILFVELLRRPGPFRSFIFMLGLVAQTIGTPESAYLTISLLLALVAYEAFSRESQPLWNQFGRTVWCAIWGSILTGSFLVFLLARQAFDDFIGYYLTFAANHRLRGGIPIQWQPGEFTLAVILPVALVLWGWLYFALSLRSGKKLTPEDWLAMALSFFVLLYYRKFLSRADQHVYQVYALAVIAALWWIHRLTSGIDRLLSRTFPSRVGQAVLVVRPTALALLIAFLAWNVDRMLPSFTSVHTNFVSAVPDPHPLPRMGFSALDAFNLSAVRDVGELLDAALAPGDPVFDFTNQPGIFHYILNRPPANRYYHISLAIGLRTQRDLVSSLEADPPKLIVFDHDTLGLPAWDGIPNSVRHYEVSHWILTHYEPYAALHGYLFLKRKGLDLSPAPPLLGAAAAKSPGDLYLQVTPRPCDWGFAPAFLAVAATSERVTLPARRVAPDLLEVTLPDNLSLSSFRWLEVSPRGRFTGATWSLSTEPTASNKSIVFKTRRGHSRPYQISVGSCAQWHGFSGRRLFLKSNAPEEIGAIALAR